MKKILFQSFLVVGLLSFILFGFAVKASAAYCDSGQDNSYFPFGFLDCDNNSGDLDFKDNTVGSNTTGGYKVISPGTSLSFTSKFTASEMAKYNTSSSGSAPTGPAKVLMWVTVDIRDAQWAGWSSVPADSDKSHPCPGSTDQYNPGNYTNIVYNYTDGNGISKYDQSPAGYDGSKGLENCQSQGKLIYWEFDSIKKNDSRSRTFSFDTKRIEGRFCLRENISVFYPGDHIFPNVELSNKDSKSADLHAATARLAKQSARHCYETQNQGPDGAFNIKTCGTYSVNGYDQDHPSEAVEFHVIHASGSGFVTDFSGTTSKNESTSNPARTYTFAPGRDYIYKIKDLDNGQWYTINHDNIAKCTNTPPPTGGSCYSFDQGTPAQWVSPGGNTYETRLNWVAEDGDSPHHQLKDAGGDLAGGTSYNAPTNHPGDTSSTDDFIATPNVTIVRNLEYWSSTIDADGDNWHDVPGWNASHPDTTWNCYRATCDISIYGQGPNGEVIRGPAGSGYDGSYTVNGVIHNYKNSAFPDKIPIPLSISDTDSNGNTITQTLSITDSGGSHHAADAGVGLDDSIGVESWPGVAAAGANSVSASGYADFANKMSIDSDNGCNGNKPVTVPVYEYATFDALATAQLMPNDEDPTSINYTTYFTNNSPYTVSAATTSCLYKVPNDCNNSPINGPINTSSFPASPKDTYTQGSALSPANSAITTPVQTGDTYCSYISIPYTVALVTNFGGTVTVIPQDSGKVSKACPEVTDKPFFKAYDSGISAGGNFSSTSAGSCSGGGTLGGWFNNMTPGYGFGSSAELSALALIKTTGVASAQTSPARSQTDLSIANQSADITQNNYSPSLGGNYGSGLSRCLTDTNPKTGATTLTTTTDFAGHDTIDLGSLASGSYNYTGDNLTINGGTNYANGKNIAIFSAGNVYINTDITYAGASSWASKADVPSFVINSKKNIYIDKNVTKLDGQYIAEPAAANTFGTIYTCGDYSTGIMKPIDRSNLWSCNNQLLVHGNFIADHVNLMRTYGSLRDEKPVGATTLSGVIWNCGGDHCNNYPNPDTNPALRCAKITQPSDPDTWTDNFVCVPKTSGIYLGWTYNNNPNNAANAAVQTKANSGSPVDLPNCTKWDVPGDDPQWNFSWLCTSSNANLTFSKNGMIAGQACTQVFEPSDFDGGNIWLEASQKTYLCEPVPSPGHISSPLTCSNAGVTVYASTCAAEIFDFSPEMYLSVPNVDPPNKGAPIWQGITSLPPVL